MPIDKCFPVAPSHTSSPNRQRAPQHRTRLRTTHNPALPRLISFKASKLRLSLRSLSVDETSENSDLDLRVHASPSLSDLAAEAAVTRSPPIGGSVGVVPGLLRKPDDSESAEEVCVTGSVTSDKPGSGLAPLLDMHPFESCLLMLSIVVNICHDHMTLTTCRETVWHSASALLTQHFVDIHLYINISGAPLPAGWKLENFYCLQRYLLRVNLLVFCQLSLLEDCPCSNVDFALSGLTPMLDIARCMLDDTDAVSCVSDAKHLNDVVLVSEILIGSNSYIATLFENTTPNGSRISHTIKIFHQLSHCDLFPLFEKLTVVASQLPETVQQNSELTANLSGPRLLSQMIHNFGNVIAAIKSCRMTFMHKEKCGKKRHKHCNICSYREHHCNLFGTAANDVGSDLCSTPDEAFSEDGGHDSVVPGTATKASNRCAISVVTNQLLRWYSQSKSPVLPQIVLDVLRTNGICCCMSPERLITTLLSGLNRQTEPFVDAVLVTLRQLLLSNLGGFSSVQPVPCSVCYSIGPANASKHASVSDSRFSSKPPQPSARLNSDSALSGSDNGTMPESVRRSGTRWRCVRAYRHLLSGGELSVAVRVAKHVLWLVVEAKCELRLAFYEEVLWPILQYSFSEITAESVAGSTMNSTTSPAVVQYVIHALAVVLRTHEVRERFLTNSGIGWLLKALAVSDYRKRCLQVVYVLLQDNADIETEFVIPQSQAPSRSANSHPSSDLETSGETCIIRTPSPVPSDVHSDHDNELSNEKSRDHHLQSERSKCADQLTDKVLDVLFRLNRNNTRQIHEMANEALHPETGVDVSLLRLSADLWVLCSHVAHSSKAFANQLLARNGARTAMTSLLTSIGELQKYADNKMTVRSQVYTCWLDTARATLLICLLFGLRREKFNTEVVC